MGVTSSPGPGRPRPARRSIRFTFTAMVAVPVICLVVLWAVAASLTPGGALARHSMFSHNHKDLAEVAVYVGGGLLVILVAALLMGSFARRLSRDITGLEETARRLASQQLPQYPATAAAQEETAGGGQVIIRPPRTKTLEIAQASAAIADLQRSFATAAAEGASLRQGIAQVFVSLARRNQSLLQRQLRLIDALEQKAADPAALADLFSLDHLTTRMRRHAENLIILSGAPPGRTWSEPVPVIDVVRAALAEVEDYQRVRVVTRTQDAVTGSAVADMIHLLAELIENAALFSPTETRVEVRAERVANGFAIEVEDRGLGMQPEALSEINRQLINPPDFALADPDRLGLFVVAKLASRHRIRVTLNHSPYGGTTAVALVPHGIVVPAGIGIAELSPAAIGAPGLHLAVPPTGGTAELGRGSGDPLALDGRRPVLPAPPVPPPDLADGPTIAPADWPAADLGNWSANDSGDWPSAAPGDWPPGSPGDRQAAGRGGSGPSYVDPFSPDSSLSSPEYLLSRDPAPGGSPAPGDAPPSRDAGSTGGTLPTQRSASPDDILPSRGSASPGSALPSQRSPGDALPSRSSASGGDSLPTRDPMSSGDALSSRDSMSPGDALSSRDPLSPGDALPSRDSMSAGDALPSRDSMSPGDSLPSRRSLSADGIPSIGDASPTRDTASPGDSLLSRDPVPDGDSLLSRDPASPGDSLRSRRSLSSDGSSASDALPTRDPASPGDSLPTRSPAGPRGAPSIGDALPSRDPASPGDSLPTRSPAGAGGAPSIGDALPTRDPASPGDVLPTRDSASPGDSLPSRSPAGPGAPSIGDGLPSRDSMSSGGSWPSRSSSPLGDSRSGRSSAFPGDSLPSRDSVSLGDALPSRNSLPAGDSLPSRDSVSLGDALPFRRSVPPAEGDPLSPGGSASGSGLPSRRSLSPDSFSPGGSGRSGGSLDDTFIPGRLGRALRPGSPDASGRPDSAISDTSATGAASAGEPGRGSGSSLPTRKPPAGTYRGLPRRVRQASLSRHLKDSSPADAETSAAAPGAAEERTPEKARDFVASFRTGWRRDSAKEAADPQPGADAASGQQDSTGPQSEET